MKILIGALFLSLWQSLLFWKQDLGISVLLFTIPIIWITTKLLKGNIKNKKALLISIPIIVLSSTYFIFDNLTFYLINIVLIPILYLIMIIWAISDFQIKSIIYKIILMIFEPLNYIGDVIKTVLKEFNPKEKDEQILRLKFLLLLALKNSLKNLLIIYFLVLKMIQLVFGNLIFLVKAYMNLLMRDYKQNLLKCLKKLNLNFKKHWNVLLMKVLAD